MYLEQRYRPLVWKSRRECRVSMTQETFTWFKINNRNTGEMRGICSKLTTWTPTTSVIDIFLVSFLLTLSIFHTFFYCFYCWLLLFVMNAMWMSELIFDKNSVSQNEIWRFEKARIKDSYRNVKSEIACLMKWNSSYDCIVSIIVIYKSNQ